MTTTPTPPAVGDQVRPLERRITLTDMVAYAGATWDWHQLHYDPEYVAAKGLPGPVVDGQVFGAYLVEALQDWLGPDSFVRTLDFSYRNLVFAGETIRCTGAVTEAHPDRILVELRVDVVGDDGEAARSVVASASAEVLVGPADGAP